jgi:hypothetical protein
LDFTTHTRYGRSIQHTTGQLTHTRRSDGAPESDGTLQKVDRDKIRYYHQIYLDRPDPLVFMPVEVDTSGRVDDDNRVNVQLGMSGPKLSIRVVGDLLGDDPLDLGVTFTKFLISAAPLPTIELPLPRPLGRLRTTFCDKDMRLSRGGRGGIFVLKKISDSLAI